MSDSSSRIGGSTTGTSSIYTGVTQTAEGAAARSSVAPRSSTAGSGTGAPGGGRGRVERIVTGDKSADQLDRSAPRGTYLNILT